MCEEEVSLKMWIFSVIRILWENREKVDRRINEKRLNRIGTEGYFLQY